MLNKKTRVDIAREAYLRGDVSMARKAHGKSAIRDSINHEEAHKTSFSLPEIILEAGEPALDIKNLLLSDNKLFFINRYNNRVYSLEL